MSSGKAGMNGITLSGQAMAGFGGDSMFGAGGWSPTGAGARQGAGYGSGSSGANSQNTAAQASNAGQPGILIVYEYA